MEGDLQTLQQLTLDSIRHLEEQSPDQLGLYQIQIEQYLFKLPEFQSFKENIFFFENELLRLFINDIIYLSRDMTRISTTKVADNFETYSEKLKRQYPDYYVTQEMLILPKEDTPRVNFDEYMRFITSVDDQILEGKLRWIFEGDSYYLDEQVKVPKVVLASQHRSGHTFFRKYFQTITNINVGADIKIGKRLSSFAIQLQGLKAQQIIDDKVWVIGSHAPDPFPPKADFDACKALLMVRNPLDTIPSMLQLLLTKTHTKKLSGNLHLDNPQQWEQFVKLSFQKWIDYHRYWIDFAKHNNFPIYILRYEDLNTRPAEVFGEIFKFLLQKESLDGTVIQKRIRQIVDEQGKSASVVYETEGQDFIKNNNSDLYSQELIETMKSQGEDLLYFFGYTNVDKNTLGFFEYDDHKEESLKMFSAFNQWNKEQMLNVIENKEEVAGIRQVIAAESVEQSAPKLPLNFEFKPIFK